MNEALITRARREFHQSLCADGTLAIDASGVATNADSSQTFSKEIARQIADAVGAPNVVKRLAGQSAGNQFETAVERFVRETFLNLGTLRPGRWRVEDVGGSRAEYHLARYVPYAHLRSLAVAIADSPMLATAIGNSYNISPDVLVVREPESDEDINRQEQLVDDRAGLYAPIRARNQSRGIVHAVISCKWTLRSDRAQNARSEALNVIRNRKGRTPHIVVVTGEPTPSRIASLALGTGDLDTIYHFALPEMIDSIERSGNTEAIQMLGTLVGGQRLRDIADLPLDLAV